MAIWQFNVALVPQSWLDAGGDVVFLFGEQGFESAVAWRNYDAARLEGMLSAGVLARSKSWHPDLTLWGNAERDDIQLWRSRGDVESIQVRFDLRTPNMALFRGIVEVASELELAIVILGSKSVIAPDTHRLLRAAAESEAAHFSVDPASFLLQAQPANARMI